MNVKLSALALGITLAWGGMSVALADTATIEQSGGFSYATIDQSNNDGSYVDASITTSGWNNFHEIEQTRSERVWAEIDAPGSFNTASIEQDRLNYGGAQIYQAAHGSSASIDQGSSGGWGWGWGGDAQNQWATINQNGGWGHDASIVQRGDRLTANVTQTGFSNTADIDQRGNGVAANRVDVVQSGSNQYANVAQDGHDLRATVTQSGWGNVAMVDMAGNGHTATVTQSGSFNFGGVHQRN